jgi:hypothetical protein
MTGVQTGRAERSIHAGSAKTGSSPFRWNLDTFDDLGGFFRMTRGSPTELNSATSGSGGDHAAFEIGNAGFVGRDLRDRLTTGVSIGSTFMNARARNEILDRVPTVVAPPFAERPARLAERHGPRRTDGSDAFKCRKLAAVRPQGAWARRFSRAGSRSSSSPKLGPLAGAESGKRKHHATAKPKHNPDQK